MKRIYPLLILLAISTAGIGQNSVELGIMPGVSNYYGDLGNGEFMQSSSMHPGVSMTLRNLIGPNQISGMAYSRFNVEARFSWHRIGYDETEPIRGKEVSELRNYGRGLGFRNDVYGVSTHLSYTYYPNRRLPLHRQSLALFVYGGIGIYHSNPKADLFAGSADIANRYHFWDDGTVRDAPQESGSGNIIEKDGEYETELRDWFTEGQGTSTEAGESRKMYPVWNVGFPLGFGFRCGLSKKLTLSAEFGYYKFLSDYIDDVSESYATAEQINQRFPNDPVKQELAHYISDPSGKGTNDLSGPPTSPRGNPGISDSYSFIGIELSYRLNWHPRETVSALFSSR